jgi:hypothetical protein
MLKDRRSFNKRQYTFNPYGIEVNIDEKKLQKKGITILYEIYTKMSTRIRLRKSTRHLSKACQKGS